MSDQAPSAEPIPAEKKSRLKFGSKKDPSKPPGKKSPLLQRNVMAAAATALFAVVGVLLLVSYIQSEEQDAAAARALQPVMVATAPIQSGTTLNVLLTEEPSRISVQEVPVDAIAAGAFISLEQLSTYEELQAVGELMINAELSTGEQLLSGRVSPIESYSRRVSPVSVPADHHQLTLSLPPNRALGGLVRSGDRVSVVASFNGGAGIDTTTAMILSSIEVVNVQVEDMIRGEEVAVDPDQPLLAPTGLYLITVAVTPEELTKLIYATEYGRIVLAAAADTRSTGDTYAQQLESVLNSPSFSPDSESSETLAFEGDLLGRPAVEDDAPAVGGEGEDE